MDVLFCLDAHEEALARFSTPEIFNTDQGSQFTSSAWHAGGRWHSHLDGRSGPLDGQCVHRATVARSLKHEDIYLKGYADGRDAHAGVASWLAFYNAVRPHQALANRTPMAVWHEGMAAGLAVDMTLRLDNAAAMAPRMGSTSACAASTDLPLRIVSIRRRPRAGHFRLRRLDQRSGWRSANSMAAARRAFGQDARRCARERRRARLADRRRSSWR